MVTILDERSFVFIWPPVPLHFRLSQTTAAPLLEIMRQQKSTNVICSFATSLTLRPKVKSSGPETTREHDFQVFLLQIPCSTSVDCTSLVYEGRN